MWWELIRSEELNRLEQTIKTKGKRNGLHRKKWATWKTGLNVSMSTLFTAVNNVVQHCCTGFRLSNIGQYCWYLHANNVGNTIQSCRLDRAAQTILGARAKFLITPTPYLLLSYLRIVSNTNIIFCVYCAFERPHKPGAPPFTLPPPPGRPWLCLQYKNT